MALHGLRSVTIGVPNVPETAAYYSDFGLMPRWRRLVPDDRRRTAATAGLRAGPPPGRDESWRRIPRMTSTASPPAWPGCGCSSELVPGGLSVIEPVTGLTVRVEVAPRIRQAPPPAPRYNAPGRAERIGQRAQPPLLEHAGPATAAWPCRHRQHRLRDRRTDSSSKAWASVSATGSRARRHSCAARPIITTCWSPQRPSTSCTTPHGRSTT